jgi:hypothetical protein
MGRAPICGKQLEPRFYRPGGRDRRGQLRLSRARDVGRSRLAHSESGGFRLAADLFAHTATAQTDWRHRNKRVTQAAPRGRREDLLSTITSARSGGPGRLRCSRRVVRGRRASRARDRSRRPRRMRDRDRAPSLWASAARSECAIGPRPRRRVQRKGDDERTWCDALASDRPSDRLPQRRPARAQERWPRSRRPASGFRKH